MYSARLSEKNSGASWPPEFSFFVARTSILVAKNYIWELMDLVFRRITDYH